jgi:hypothetical protein
MAAENSTGNGESRKDIEFRVMPSGDGRWYWEIIRGGREVMMRGVADTEPAACQEASDAARKSNLIP